MCRRTAPDSIIPDLAMSWAWSEDGKELAFPLRQGVKWHDGKPFTAADVKCTWDLLMDVGGEKLRVNPRKTWYRIDRLESCFDAIDDRLRRIEQIVTRIDERLAATLPHLAREGGFRIRRCTVCRHNIHADVRNQSPTRL